jgi:hypothetical protein
MLPTVEFDRRNPLIMPDRLVMWMFPRTRRMLAAGGLESQSLTRGAN